MPEALALFTVIAAAVAIAAAMWVRLRDPALHRPHEEWERLRHHHAWLTGRLAAARRENWGAEMVAKLTMELEATTAQLTKAGG